MRIDDQLWPSGDTATPRDASVEVYEEHHDRFWLVRGDEMRGPFRHDQILRALRVACTPMIDGCELGPSQSGFVTLEGAHAFEPRLTQSWRTPNELPPSTTRYGAIADVPTEDRGHGEVLSKTWNLHPRGARIVRDATGVVIIET